MTKDMRIETNELFEALNPSNWRPVNGILSQQVERVGSICVRAWILDPNGAPMRVWGLLHQRTDRLPIPEDLYANRHLISEFWDRHTPGTGRREYWLAIPGYTNLGITEYRMRSYDGGGYRWTKDELISLHKPELLREFKTATANAERLRKRLEALEPDGPLRTIAPATIGEDMFCTTGNSHSVAVYAWNADPDRLLLVSLYEDKGPYVINGNFTLQHTDDPKILQAPWDTDLKAVYMCEAPNRVNYSDYNEILTDVRATQFSIP